MPETTTQRRADLIIERSRLVRDQSRIANALNNGGFFPRRPGTPDPPRLLALYAESEQNKTTIKAINAALAELDADTTTTEGT